MFVFLLLFLTCSYPVFWYSGILYKGLTIHPVIGQNIQCVRFIIAPPAAEMFLSAGVSKAMSLRSVFLAKTFRVV